MLYRHLKNKKYAILSFVPRNTAYQASCIYIHLYIEPPLLSRVTPLYVMIPIWDISLLGHTVSIE